MTEDDHETTLKRLITNPLDDKWDKGMATAGAWSDPTLPLEDRVNERRKALLAQRDDARAEYIITQNHLKELEAKIQQLTGAIHISDEFIDALMHTAQD